MNPNGTYAHKYIHDKVTNYSVTLVVSPAINFHETFQKVNLPYLARKKQKATLPVLKLLHLLYNGGQPSRMTLPCILVIIGAWANFF